MEQEAIYKPGSFDRRKVDLARLPRNVDEYIKQVIVGREQCPDVVVAEVDNTTIKPCDVVVPVDPSIDAVCDSAPGPAWRQVKADDFGRIRDKFAKLRELFDGTESFSFPSPKESGKWVEFCLRKRSIDVPPQLQDQFQHHAGNPPTMKLTISLPDRSVNSLLVILCKHFVDGGYTRPLSEWIFALLVSVRKPLQHDVCSAIRDFARFCRLQRAQTKDPNLIREYSLFITIVGVYFLQKDIADRTQ